VERRTLEHFLKWVYPEPNTGCWIWTGATDGYTLYGKVGKLFYGYRKTHRIFWFLFYGHVPKGKCVLHKCDNQYCVNPEHLFIGTLKENNDDKMAKGRHKVPLGEEQYLALLTDQQVITMRLEHTHRYGLKPTGYWMRLYSVSRSVIKSALQRKTYNHV
jgi:hypothetical protein